MPRQLERIANGYFGILGDHSTNTENPSDERKCLPNNRGNNENNENDQFHPRIRKKRKKGTVYVSEEVNSVSRVWSKYFTDGKR